MISVSVLWLGMVITAFLIKHLLADFVFQTNWMVFGKEQIHDWLAPLCAHAAVHGAMTFVLMLALLPSLWWLGLVDFAIHGIIDRSKALTTRAFGLSLKDSRWWWMLGLDQTLHHLTHLVYVLALLTLVART